MNFLKPTKGKLKLFLIIIFSVLAVSVLFVLVNLFLATNWLMENPVYYRLSYFFINLLRYFIVAYLIMLLYKKRISLKGEYYFVFKIFILLAVFSYLHHSLLNLIVSINPEIFFTNWINIEFVFVNILFCYLLAGIVYRFKS